MSRVARRIITRLAGLAALATMAGCSVGTATVAAPQQVAPTGPRRPRPVVGLVDVKLSRLLDFETDADLVFVQNRLASTATRVTSPDAGTGRGALRVVRGSDGATFRLTSLLQGRAFPGTWNLIGLQARAVGRGESVVTLSLRRNGVEVASRRVPILIDAQGPGDARWDWVWLELPSTLAPTTAPAAATGTSRSTDQWELRAALIGPGALELDSVALGDNARVFSSARDGDPPEPGMRLALHGLMWAIESPGEFTFGIPSAESGADGYLRQGMDPWRVFFATRDGRQYVIDRLGRGYREGRFEPVGPARDDPAYAAQHDRPARIDLEADEFGRVERTSSGDRDNDGYDESRGTYRLAAAGPKMLLTIEPQGAPLLNPVLEVRNLPPGEVVVNVEGKLVDRWVRLDDGTVLVELPLQIIRATRVELRVKLAGAIATEGLMSRPARGQ